MPGQRKKVTYEQAVEEIETIVQRLEDGESGLEESLKLFEKGMELLKFCEGKLNEAQNKVEKIIQQGEEFETKPLDAEKDDRNLEEQD